MDGYFDIHTHILPHNDDGSSSSAESVDMLKALYAQGVTRVAATPHFKATGDEPQRFLKRRNSSVARLESRIRELCAEDETLAAALPDIYIGAEVAFFNAMSNVLELSDMCLSGTKFLLVEMPFEKWSVAMIDELSELMNKQGIIPIIAHIDRYFGYFNDTMLDKMIENGVKVQVNADAFLSIWTRRRALELLSSGKVHFLGSDAHNMDKRAPRIDEAVREIEKRLGSAALDIVKENSEELAALSTPMLKGN